MTIVRTVQQLRSSLHAKRDIGLVPTMGALHEGHLQLISNCSSESGLTVVSIFVNPTQFAPGEDFEKYPRDEARDAELARSAGADVLFCPDVEEVYPLGTVNVNVRKVSDTLEGAVRPGHFDGVATVVLKLFHMVAPQKAFFGLKDLQQCAVVRNLIEDTCLPIELRLIETVREPDGLARSSRNVYLSAAERETAPRLFRRLSECARRIHVDGSEVRSELAHVRDGLTSDRFQVDYVELVDPITFEILDSPRPGSRLVAAARLSSVRLLDNVPVVH